MKESELVNVCSGTTFKCVRECLNFTVIMYCSVSERLDSIFSLRTNSASTTVWQVVTKERGYETYLALPHLPLG